MQTLRKQTIISTLYILLGFGFGAINIYFYTKNGSFTAEQFGLTKIYFDFSQLAYAFASLGFLPVIYKFYPYYNDNLDKKKNDLLSIAFVICMIGFLLFCIVGYLIKPYFIKQYIVRSKLIVDYFPLLFVFSFGALIFAILESYCWAIHKSVVSNFLKETALRFLSLILILFFYFKFFSFDIFIHLFSYQFFLIFSILIGYLIYIKRIDLYFGISRVTKKFWKKMLSMQALLFSGAIIVTLSNVIDGFVIAKLLGLGAVGTFGVAQYAGSLINVPQKSIIGGSVGILSQHWKDKNFSEINRIYQRSCINLSLMALFIFGNIWLNVVPCIELFNIQDGYKAALSTLFFIGIARTIDASTGLNSIIIGTSTFWRFDFISGMILLAIRLPASWFFIVKFGILGSAFADVISIIIYNFIRFEYLRRKFKMQPFNLKNLYAIILAIVCYFFTYYLCISVNGFTGIILRGLIFSSTLIVGIFTLNLTPDAWQLWNKWVVRK